MLKFLKRIVIGRSVEPPPEDAQIRRIRFFEQASENYPTIPLPEDLDSPVRMVERVKTGGPSQARAVWAIKTRVGEHYMVAQRSNYLNDERWVVVVQARAFMAAWLAGRDQPTGRTNDPPDIQDLPRMNAWSYQPSAWSHGLVNPVPLAEIGTSFLHHPDCHLGFINGRNRLAWLIYHGAAAFPVEVNTALAANELHDMMGLPDFPPVTVAQLTD